MRTRSIAALLLAAGSLAASPTVGAGQASPRGEVTVGRDEATFAFPQMAVRDWSCSYRAGNHPDERLYSWTMNVAGPGSPWYTIDVWPQVPESVAVKSPTLKTILSFARPEIGIAGGEPPLKIGIVKGTPQVSEEDGRLVVRVRGTDVVRRLFQSHPDSVRVIACVDGNDSWTRVLPVNYR